MHKRIFSFFLVLVLMLSLMPTTFFADEHQHTFGENKRGMDMSALPEEYSCPVTFYETPCESLCGYSKYEWTFAGASDSFVDTSGLNVVQVYYRWRKWFEKAYGAAADLKKIDATNGGANIPAPGGRNPKGYGDEGKANVTSQGVGCIWVEPFGISNAASGFSINAPSSCLTGSSPSGTSFPYTTSNVIITYYFTAPVTGLYYVGSFGNPFDVGTVSFFYNNTWNLFGEPQNFTSAYYKSISLSKGTQCYYSYYLNANVKGTNRPFRSSLNKIPIFVDPLADSSITTTNNITINNNTWNGNIYTDNSTNLTYIYPQYTTINEKNETVTNISNTPIIYNNETKQYYTYDQTTKNYYYISHTFLIT